MRSQKTAEQQTHKQLFTGLSWDLLGNLFIGFHLLHRQMHPKNHINNSMIPAQSRNNPAKMFMFRASFLSPRGMCETKFAICRDSNSWGEYLQTKCSGLFRCETESKHRRRVAGDNLHPKIQHHLLNGKFMKHQPLTS